VNRALTGIEIHPGARIGRGVFIDHGMGVVIGETASIGDDVTMYQGVTLGGTGKQRGKRHPTVERNAVIGVGASVLGAVTIGEGARVGAGSVVLKDVPAHTTAVGLPARAVSWRDPESGEMRRLEHLPDPDRDTMIAMLQRIEELESRVRELECERADCGPLAQAR
jgi:serine O-acetyltransferase